MEELEGAIEEFLGYIQDVRGYSETSVITYEIALRQMAQSSRLSQNGIEWTIDLTPFRIKIVKNSKKTIAKKLSAVRSFVEYLRTQRALGVTLIGDESVKTPQTLPKPVEERYIFEMLEEADTKEKLVVVMLYGLGLRISELSGLKLADIHNEWIEIRGKGNKTRELPLLDAVRSSIENYLDLYHPKQYLFEKGGVPMNQAQLRYLLTQSFKSRGLKVTPHQFRHSFATHLLNNGARISDVSELLGHSSMATTQLYTKLGDARKLQEYLTAHPLVKKAN